jgi:hypothetical protein
MLNADHLEAQPAAIQQHHGKLPMPLEVALLRFQQRL